VTPASSSFSADDREIDARTQLIELSGEVDLYTAPELKERLGRAIDAGKHRIVVDLSATTLIDSTALGVLVGGVKRLRPEGGAIAIVCDEPNVRKVFEITGLDRVFTICDTREQALEAVAAEDAS